MSIGNQSAYRDLGPSQRRKINCNASIASTRTDERRLTVSSQSKKGVSMFMSAFGFELKVRSVFELLVEELLEFLDLLRCEFRVLGEVHQQRSRGTAEHAVEE